MFRARDQCGRTLLAYTEPLPQPHRTPELECQLRARPNRPTSVPDPTNALVTEWKQHPAEMFQHLVNCHPRRVEAVIEKVEQLHINAHDCGMGCSTSRCPHTFGHVVYILYTEYIDI